MSSVLTKIGYKMYKKTIKGDEQSIPDPAGLCDDSRPWIVDGMWLHTRQQARHMDADSGHWEEKP